MHTGCICQCSSLFFFWRKVLLFFAARSIRWARLAAWSSSRGFVCLEQTDTNWHNCLYPFKLLLSGCNNESDAQLLSFKFCFAWNALDLIRFPSRWTLRHSSPPHRLYNCSWAIHYILARRNEELRKVVSFHNIKNRKTRYRRLYPEIVMYHGPNILLTKTQSLAILS